MERPVRAESFSNAGFRYPRFMRSDANEQKGTKLMTRTEALAFADEWIAAWNDKDVERVLAHFSDAVRFTSPRAATTVGTALVAGKEQLRDYWRAALARIDSLRFTLDHIVWDEQRSELLIVYTSETGNGCTRAGELLYLGPTGMVDVGEALYGASV